MLLKKIGISILGIAVLGTLVATGYAMKGGKNEKTKQQNQEHASSTLALFESAGIDEGSLDDGSRTSWPGEIISASTADVHPLSEGIITEISVRVGQKVGRGETVGMLSAPPASVEQAMAAADKMQMLVKARTNAETTEKLAKEQIEYLTKTKASIIPVRDFGIGAAEKELDYKRQLQTNASVDYDRMKKEKDAGVELARKERDSTAVKVVSMERALRTLLDQVLERNLKDLTTNNEDYRLLLKYWSIHYKSTVVNQERSTYEDALSRLIGQLQQDGDVPDGLALNYVGVLRKYALTLQSGEEMMSRDVIEAQAAAREQEKMVVGMVNDLRNERAMLDMKEADLAKMIAMRESELIKAKLMITTSAIETEQSDAVRKKMTSEAELMYLDQKREIDEKISMLKRDLEMARSEVRAAEAAYDTFVGQLASQRIVAIKPGVVGGVFKNVGDFVMPSDTIASISTGEQNDMFVRFRVSNDAIPPEAGTEVVIIRPGFPFDKQMGVITGTGTSLNEQGAFVAEAEFDEQPPWPVRALVRVSLANADDRVLVPFTAIGWDEEKRAHLKVADEKGAVSDRVVRTGRAIGDRVEIVEGLMKGERYSIRYDAQGSAQAMPASDIPHDSEEGAEQGGHQHGE